MATDALPMAHLVLLVDDELRTARRLAEMLREDGLTVEVARDGAAAIARFTHAPLPDALITELTTAHADGASVSLFARTQKPGLPVLVVTGYPNLFQPNAFGLPTPLLFTKPIDYSKLKDALLRALPEPRTDSADVPENSPAPSSKPALDSRPKDAPFFAGDPLSGAQAVRALRRS